jgi:hypothetical protein
MEAKRIKFERTGGFANIRFAADIELDEMPHDQAEHILELLDELDFDKLPEQIPGNQQLRDGFLYSITVVTDKREQTVTTTDMAAPPKMEPLLEILMQIAKQQARNKK